MICRLMTVIFFLSGWWCGAFLLCRGYVSERLKWVTSNTKNKKKTKLLLPLITQRHPLVATRARSTAVLSSIFNKNRKKSREQVFFFSFLRHVARQGTTTRAYFWSANALSHSPSIDVNHANASLLMRSTSAGIIEGVGIPSPRARLWYTTFVTLLMMTNSPFSCGVLTIVIEQRSGPRSAFSM